MRLVLSGGRRSRKRRPACGPVGGGGGRIDRPTWSGSVHRPRWTGRRAPLVEGWPDKVLVRGRITVNEELGTVDSYHVKVSIDHGESWIDAPEWAEDLAVKQAVRDAARSKR